MTLKTHPFMISRKVDLALLFVGVFICFFLINKAHATTVTSSDLSTNTCNTTYYETLKSRAWLEGQRRTVQAQNYILKPDSVLDYNCFTILNNIAALETEQIFSESHAGHCFPESLDCALDILVISALQPYLTGNFDHSFLGGRTSLNRADYDPDSTEMCTVMSDVWRLAKCMNFMLDSTQDGFLSFEEYASLDPRRLPTECTTNDPALWTNAIENAFAPTAPSSWYQEILSVSDTNNTNYTQYLEPGDGAEGCGDLIRTGILIQDAASIFYRTGLVDGVCANPACSQDRLGNCFLIAF